jgi:hypothetical protein
LVHDAAIAQDIAASFGRGAALSAVAGATVEVGTAYGPDGCYGCYLTTCVGGESNVEANVFGSFGQYVSLDDFSGRAILEVGSVGIEVLSVAAGQVINPTTGEIVGVFEAISVGLSAIPVTVGLYDCDTRLDIVGCLNEDGALVEVTNNPPTARCLNVTVEADAEAGLVDASIDDESFDPDGDSITLLQDPPGPYGVDVHTVTLTVTDSVGDSDSCVADVTVVEPPTFQGPCGAGVGVTMQAPAMILMFFALCGLRLVRSRRRRDRCHPGVD